MTTARDNLPKADQKAPAVGIRLDRHVRRQLSRREAQVMRHLLAETRICADYLGGPAEDMNNWEFAIWGNGWIEGCAPSARMLIAKGVAQVSEPDALGYRFLTPNAI